MLQKTILLAALLVFPARFAFADLMVSATYTTQFIPLGYEYSLTVTSDAANTVIGVIVENGFTVFGLSPSSYVVAPANWSYLPPLDSVDDALTYLSNGGDIQPSTSLGGFVFDSGTAPVPFQVALVTLTGVTELTVTATPEPYVSLLSATGLGLGGCYLAVIRRRRTHVT